MKKPVNIKKIILPNLPYLLFALLGTKCGQAARLAPGLDFSQKALHILDGFRLAFESLLPSFHPADLLVGLLIAAALRLAVYVKGKNAKKFRKNMEYGSARWGTHEDIAPYIDPVFENNIILTQTESLTMNNRPKDPRTARNKNVLVIGGSGSGKTRFFIKPNLMQCQSKDYPVSFVVTDPKGSIVVECGRLLERNNYRIKIFNTINFSKSMHYNPFAYIHSEKDILKLVNTLICNTKGDGKSGDDFWVKAETLLYCALIGYIHYEAPEEEQNFATLIELVNAMEVREDDETFENPVDIAFKELEKDKPNHFAVRQYKKYKLAAGKTAKSINISCGARLAPFDIAELREITMYDELELDTLGDKIYDNPNAKDGSFKKTALFLIMSAVDVLVNGDGNANAAEKLKIGTSPMSGTKGTLTYAQLVEFWSQFDPYTLNTMLVPGGTMVKLLSLSELQDAAAGLNFQGTGALATPLGAELVRSGCVTDGTIIGLDRRYALEMVQAGEVSVEYDKLIDRQLERAAITSISGFGKIMPEAAKVLVI